MNDEPAPSDLKIATSKDGLAFTNFRTLARYWHDPIVIRGIACFERR